MRNQFIYIEKITKPPLEEGGESIVEDRKNSFNVDMVIRAIMMDDGGLLILMDDLHERWQDKTYINKNGKRATKREKDTFQSEIRLSKKEGELYFKIAEITKDND